MRDLQEHERPLAERYRLAAKAANEASKVSRYYRENKGIVFAQMVMEVLRQDPSLPVNKAELLVKASDAWKAFIDRLLEASDQAGEKKTDLKTIEIEAESIKQANISAARERRYG